MRSNSYIIRWTLALLCAVVWNVAWADDTKVEELLRQFDAVQQGIAPGGASKARLTTVANAFLKELQAREFFEEPIQFTAADGVDTLRQQVWYWAAEWFYDQARYQQAVDYARRALPLLHIPNEQADCQSLVSIIYVRLGDYRQAADYAQRVYQLDQLSGDKDRQSSSLNTLAGIYLYANQPQEAEKYVLRGIELAEQTGNDARLAVLQGKASEIYHALGNEQEALRYAEAAYQLDKEAGRNERAATRLAQKASVLIGMRRYQEAGQVLESIIPVFRKAGDRQSLGIACNKMGQVLLGQKRPSDAVAYYREAAKLFAAAGDIANELHAHRGLYEALWKLDPDEAKRELDLFNALRDSIYNHASAESLAKYNAEFGNDWLVIENHEIRAARRNALILVAVITLLAIAVWWFMRRRHRQQQAVNEQLTTNINELRRQFETLTIQYDNAMITRNDDDERQELRQADRDFLEKTINIINALLNEGQLDAATVAERMGMSLFQFRQRITAVTGESPKNFVQIIRMRRARHLLDHHAELNITEIGQLCAYNDTSSFTRAFKNAFGLSPMQYLERQGQTKNTR